MKRATENFFFLYVFLLSSCSLFAPVGQVVPGEQLWCITKNIANTVDAIESKLDTLIPDAAVASLNIETNSTPAVAHPSSYHMTTINHHTATQFIVINKTADTRRDIARIKTILGSILIATAAYSTLAGSITAAVSYSYCNHLFLIIGSTVIAISIPLGYGGYKLTKAGLDDLEKLALHHEQS